MTPTEVGLALALCVSVLVSVLAIARLHDGPSWSAVLRARFVHGVPWGSIVVIAGVLAAYLFVQDGLSNFENPVVLPYRAWSYYYPLGIVSAPFTHADPGHLFNNLFATAVLAPLAEYVWGHYPRGRDGHETTSWATTPWIRAVVLFPLGVVLVGLATSVFGLGPLIGFSGAVFAFAGFAVVRYPVTTLVALLGGQGALLTIYQALQAPITEYVAQPSPPSAPSWATIAIQGHGLGLLIGLVCGLIVLRRRAYRPDPLRLWIALLLLGFAQGLWAIYWFAGQNTFVLFRGLGATVVVALALLVTLAATASEQPLLTLDRYRSAREEVTSLVPARILEIGLSEQPPGGDRTARVRALAGTGTDPDESPWLTRRTAAFTVLVLVLAAVAGPAIPVNLFVTDGAQTGGGAVTVEDYTVYYDEGVSNEFVSFVDISAFDQGTQLEASGVIVSSERRHLWLEAVSAQQLAYTGSETVSVGGPGWRETVHVDRQGWIPTGNESVYRVETWEAGEERQVAYESQPMRADARLDNRTVTVASVDGTFSLLVEGPTNGSVESTPIPDPGEVSTAGNTTFARTDGTVYARTNGTEIPVATQETYL